MPKVESNLSLSFCYTAHQANFLYLWDETNGKKGSNEIGSCLLKYLEGLPSHVRHVTSFSDTCGGQNRNRNTSAAMVYAIQKIDHLEIIDLKFMESGHSYLEADSMHARIEEARRHKLLYTPHEYGIVIQCARINPKPYELNMIKFSDIYDWKTYSNDVLKNVKTVTKEENGKTVAVLGTDGKFEVVSWMKIKWLRFEKTRPNVIQCKYDLNAEKFFEFDFTGTHQKPVGRRKCTSGKSVSDHTVQRAYTSRIPIANLKKKDLLNMLKKNIIPIDYKEYYQNLPTKNPVEPNCEQPKPAKNPVEPKPKEKGAPKRRAQRKLSFS